MGDDGGDQGALMDGSIMDDPAVRDILNAERLAALVRVRALHSDLEGIVADSVNANADDEHDPEGATIAFERERTSALRAQAIAHLSDLDQALTRLTGGTYGTCTSCGHPIDAERLKVLPITQLCTACAARPRSPLEPRP
jgi:RNA polymerase-binding transcription factor DksA